MDDEIQPRNDWWASWRGPVLALGLAGLLGGCGSDGDAADGGSSNAPAPDIEEVAACLEAGGLETSTDSAAPAALQEQLGIEGSLSLAGEGDLVGLGSVTWYVDAAAAVEADEAGAAVRTEDVARAVHGTVAYHYAGSDDAVTLIEDCLTTEP